MEVMLSKKKKEYNQNSKLELVQISKTQNPHNIQNSTIIQRALPAINKMGSKPSAATTGGKTKPILSPAHNDRAA